MEAKAKCFWCDWSGYGAVKLYVLREECLDHMRFTSCPGPVVLLRQKLAGKNPRGWVTEIWEAAK